MTYLETLIRTLPRQRRAFEQQRSMGLGMVVAGFLINSSVAIRWAALGEPVGRGTLLAVLILAGMLGTYWLLTGGYRFTKADLLIADNIALQVAVILAIEERDDARNGRTPSTANHLLEIHSLELALDARAALESEGKFAHV